MMNDDVRNWISLSSKEFMLLLAVSGVRKWYGLGDDLESVDGTSERNVTLILASLYTDGVISIKDPVDETDTGIYLNRPYAEAAGIIRDAAHIISAVSGDGQRYISYISADGAVMSKPDDMDPDVIHLLLMEKKEFTPFLLKECLSEATMDGEILKVKRIDPATGMATDTLIVSEHGLERTAVLEHTASSGTNESENVSARTSSLRNIIDSWLG